MEKWSLSSHQEEEQSNSYKSLYKNTVKLYNRNNQKPSAAKE